MKSIFAARVSNALARQRVRIAEHRADLAKAKERLNDPEYNLRITQAIILSSSERRLCDSQDDTAGT